MWSGRVTRWRRWPLVAAVLLTVAAGALLSGPWTAPGSDLGDLTWTAAAPPERLEFYGAARNLFSSNSRPVSPSPLAPTVLQASPPVPASSAPEIPASEVTAAPLPASQTTEPTTTNATPTEQGIDRFDYELDRVKPGDVLPLTETWLRERETRYDARRRRLKRACEKHHVRLMQRTTERSVMPVRDDDTGPVETIKASHFTIVSPHKTLACLVNKAASTSLLGTFLKLTGHGVPLFDDFSSPHSIASVLHPTRPGQLELAKRHYFKFMFVRHPLDRLISAYEDKVAKVDHKSLLYLRKSIFNTHEDLHIRNHTYALLRTNVANRTEVLAEYEAKLAEYREEVAARHNVPTFGEFLEFVLATDPTGDNFDSHWTPYWRQCSPCHVRYDVIGKLESGLEDFKYVWHRMNIYDKVKIPRMNALKRNSTRLEDHVRTYLSPLKDSLVVKFGEMFKIDFEMFGYDWEEMLRWSGHCPASGSCPLA